MIVGMGASSDVELPLFNALAREVDIRGGFRYANEYIKKHIFFLQKQYYKFNDLNDFKFVLVIKMQ